MRQGQQNRRGRGRHNNNNHNNNNNRKGQNPLTRSFESNGPDVKIRGTPAHIAEKYLSLARDAQASGDPVLAENYLQHAEHYTRIIMAYREQQMQQMGADPNGAYRQRPAGEQAEGGEEFGEDEGEDFSNDFTARGFEPQPRVFDPGQPQPGSPGYGRGEEHNGNGGQPPQHHRPRQDRHDRPQGQGGEGGYRQPREGRDFRPREPREYRENRGEYREREPREFREPREPREQREHREPREPREAREPREFREPREPRVERERPPIESSGGLPLPIDTPEVAPVPAPAAETAAPAPRARRDRFGGAAGYEQPEFLRRPVRRPRREAPAAPNGDAAGEAAPSDEPAPDKPVV